MKIGTRKRDQVRPSSPDGLYGNSSKQVEGTERCRVGYTVNCLN